MNIPTKKNNPFLQVAQKLEIPVGAVYGAFAMIVFMSTLVVTSQASLQTQNLASQASYQIVGCNQACASNRNCQANHFCYQGRCRLAANPQDETCGGTASGYDASQDPTQKGYDPVIEEPTSPNTTGSTDSSLDYDPLNPTTPLSKLNDSFDFFDNMGGKDSKIMLYIGIGLIGLVVLITIISMLGSSSSKKDSKAIKTFNAPKPDFSNLEKNQQSEIKLEKTKTIE